MPGKNQSVQYANITPWCFPTATCFNLIKLCSLGSLFEFSLQPPHGFTRWLPLLHCMAPSDQEKVEALHFQLHHQCHLKVSSLTSQMACRSLSLSTAPGGALREANCEGKCHLRFLQYRCAPHSWRSRRVRCAKAQRQIQRFPATKGCPGVHFLPQGGR